MYRLQIRDIQWRTGGRGHFFLGSISFIWIQFSIKVGHIIGWRIPLWGLRPYEKSWIRHYCKFILSFEVTSESSLESDESLPLSDSSSLSGLNGGRFLASRARFLFSSYSYQGNLQSTNWSLIPLL